MKRSKFLVGSAAGLLIVVALAGCGGSAEEPSAPSAEAAVGAPLAARRASAPGDPTRAADPFAGTLVHPRAQRDAARAYLHGINLIHDTKEEMLEALAAYAAANPRLAVIRGYGWRADVLGSTPSALDLDAVVRDRPVILLSADLRAEWRNSRARGLPVAEGAGS